MRRAAALAAIAFFAVATAAGAEPSPPGTSPGNRIDAAAEMLVAKEPLAGLSIAVERGDRVVHADGYGFADLEGRRPARADTIYRFGSIGKMVIAALVLRLAEQGALGLDDPVSDYVPGLPRRLRALRIRHLLTHTSGLAELTMSPRYARSNGLGMTRDEAICLIASQPLGFPPGSAWRYNNSGYVLLGRIVEAVTNRTFGDAAVREVIRPSGASLAYCPGPSPDAIGYAARDGAWERALRLGRAPGFGLARPVNMRIVSSAGAFCGSVVDLIRWMSALRSGDAGGAGIFERMATPAKLRDGEVVGYGLGVMLRSFEGHRAIAHGGLMDGFTALLAHFPDDDLTLAVATNTSLTDASFSELVAAALDLPQGSAWSQVESGRSGR